MDKRIYDAVAILTALILLPMVAVSAYALYSGTITYADYAAAWREPIALLLGFWLRGIDK